MIFSWLPVIWVDVVGSSVTLVLSLICAMYSWRWAKKKQGDTFRHYLFLLTLSLAFFAVSRSFGHLVKQILLFYEMKQHIWKQIAPYSGSFNTATFIIVFSFSLYFYRSYKVHLELELHKDNLAKLVEERTAELEEKNISLKSEILERKQAENALADEKERLAVTLRSIGDGVVTTDMDGHIILMNKIAEELTGYPQEEAFNKPLPEIFHIINERTRKRCENPAEKVLSSGEVIDIARHTALIAKDGTERSIADSGAPIRDKKSRIIGVVLVFRDVTETNKMEEELLKLEKLESVGVLAGGIAHDFNNILAAILGNIDLTLFDANLNPETRKLLTEAKKASVRAKDLTQQLLTFSKGGEPVKETTSLLDIIRDSTQFVLHGSNVSCKYHVPDDLWFVEVDRGQTSQVVQNLIINAKHAMPAGGIINITCENILHSDDESVFLPQKNNYVRVSISDSGVGIPENIIDKIFDPYFSTKQEGSGLGLAISHSIISKHDGHISVQSKLGEGTTFTTYLPVSVQKQQKEKRKETIDSATSKAKIMVMDDEEMVRDVAKAMLTSLGHDVVLVQDGAEALKIYKEHSNTDNPIDIVIMDLTIPGGIGGEDAVKNILAIDQNAKVIVSSGYSNDPIMANCQEYGFEAAVIKPYQLQELTKVINQVLS